MVVLTRGFRVQLYAFVCYLVAVCLLYPSFFDAHLVVNIALLCFAIYLIPEIADVRYARNSLLRRVRSIKWLGVVFILLCTLSILALRGIRGWQSVLSTGLVYYIIFTMVWCTTSRVQERSSYPIEALMALLLSLVIFSKILFLTSFICILYFYFKKGGVLKVGYGLTSLILVVGVFFVLNVSAFDDFFYRSLFRPDSAIDTKIAGFSDGGRLTLWSELLLGAEAFERGTYYLADVIPSHNLVVYLIFEFGWAGAFFWSLPLIVSFIRLCNNGYHFFAFIFFICCSLSSIFEFAAIWFPAVVLTAQFFSFAQLRDHALG